MKIRCNMCLRDLLITEYLTENSVFAYCTNKNCPAYGRELIAMEEKSDKEKENC